ncbi:MAG: FAD-dependent oxidoreductase [Candidatus Aminicenantes bacterium]|nr:FAD-dependent oxidoreductase [Candidatus Aminicenantes bacterium]
MCPKNIKFFLLFFCLINGIGRGNQLTNPDQNKQYDTIVIGGGMAGLSAAFYLQNSDVLVLEVKDRPGGRMQSEDIKGMIMNWGTQYLLNKNIAFHQFISKLKIPMQHHTITSVKVGFVINNEYFADFTSSGNGFHNIWGIISCLSRSYRETVIARESKKERESFDMETADSLYKNLEGNIRKFIEAYLKAASSAPISNISRLWAAELLTDILSPIDVVKGGTAKIAEVLATTLGDRIIYNAEVTSVQSVDGGVTIEVKFDSKSILLRARHCIVSVPAPICMKIVNDLPEWKINALRNVHYGSYISVAYVLAKATWERGLGAVASGYTFSGWIDVNAINGDLTPPSVSKPMIMLCIVPTTPDSPLWRMADNTIAENIWNELLTIFPEIHNARLDMKVRRFEIGEPIPNMGYFTKLRQLQLPVGNIHFAGDYTDEPWLGGAAFSGMRVAQEFGVPTDWKPLFERKTINVNEWFVISFISCIISLFAFIFAIPLYRRLWPYIFCNSLQPQISILKTPPTKIIKWVKIVVGFGVFFVLLTISLIIATHNFLPPIEELYRITVIWILILSFFYPLVLIASWRHIKKHSSSPLHKSMTNTDDESVFCIRTSNDTIKNAQHGEKKFEVLVTNATNTYKKQIEKKDLVVCFMGNDIAWCIASVDRLIRIPDQDILCLSVEVMIAPPQCLLAKGKLKKRVIELVAKLQLNSSILIYLQKCLKSHNQTLNEQQSWDKPLILNFLTSGATLLISAAMIHLSNRLEWEAWVRLFIATLVGIYYIASYSSEMKYLEEFCKISLNSSDWVSLPLGGATIIGAQTLINAPLGFSMAILTLFFIDSLWVGSMLSHYRKEFELNPLLLIKYRWWFVSDFFFIFIGFATTLFLCSSPNLLSFIIILILVISMLHDFWFDSILINL